MLMHAPHSDLNTPPPSLRWPCWAVANCRLFFFAEHCTGQVSDPCLQTVAPPPLPVWAAARFSSGGRCLPMFRPLHCLLAAGQQGMGMSSCHPRSRHERGVCPQLQLL